MARGPTTPDITGHLHGYALRFGDEEVAVYPSLQGAADGYRLAKDALAMLAACLASAPLGRPAR